MHDYQENTNLFGNVQNVLFLLRRTDELFLLWHWLFWVQSNFQVTKNQQKQQKQKKESLYKAQTFAPREFHSVPVRTLTRQTNAGDIVRGPESETLPPPSGIFVDMYHFKASPKGIWKMHVCTWLLGGCGCAATFFSSAKSNRLPTPRGQSTSSETPLPTKITLRVI